MTAASMSEAGLAERFEFGSRLIEEAGALALDFYRRLETLTIRSKGTQDMVSEADVEVEKLIRRRSAVPPRSCHR